MSAFEQRMQAYRQRADHALQHRLETLPFADGQLAAAMRYGTLLGGKRLRPYLVYATGEMFAVPLVELDTPATAVECIHAYSLIHDDLPAMDNDDLRRGKPANHIKFGEAHAILAGDALQTLAFTLLAEGDMPSVSANDRIAMLSELAKAVGIGGMCGGQALDMEAEGKQIDLSALEQIHRHKTGALIRCAVRLGALAAGEKGHRALPLLDEYAQSIGLAFQVQDDILDVIGDSSKTGKRQGADENLNKSTYPALLGLKQAQEKARLLYETSLDILTTLEQQHQVNSAALKSLASFIIERDN